MTEEQLSASIASMEALLDLQKKEANAAALAAYNELIDKEFMYGVRYGTHMDFTKCFDTLVEAKDFVAGMRVGSPQEIESDPEPMLNEDAEFRAMLLLCDTLHGLKPSSFL